MKHVNVYVAGAWPERKNVRAFMDRLIQFCAPHAVQVHITFDWTAFEDIPFDERTNEYNDMCAQKDLYTGVGTAQVLIAVKTRGDYAYRGTEREIGYAQGRGIPVFVLGPTDPNSYVCKNVFYTMTRGQTTYTSEYEMLKSFLQFAQQEYKK